MRCFIAIELPQEVLQKLSTLSQELPPGVSKVKKENMHITLKFLGEVDEKKLPDVVSVLGKCVVPPFSVSLSGVGAFPKPYFPRVVWAGVHSEELARLAASIEESLDSLGFEKEKAFSGHVTLARVKNPVELRQFFAAHADDLFGSFSVNEFVLKKSTLAPSGPVYETLKRFRLAAAFE